MGQILFELCCRMVDVFGHIFGMTYYEANTFLFLRLQPIMYLLFSAYLSYLCYNNLRRGKSFLLLFYFVMSILWCIPWIILCCFVFIHYSMDWDSAARLCIDEMMKIQHVYGVDYGLQNFIYFIFTFIMVMGIDVVLLIKIKRYRNKSSV